MRAKILLYSFAAALLFCELFLFSALAPFAPFAALAAPTGSDENERLGLADFLDRNGLTFDEYVEIAARYEADGVYTHFLEKNADRYEVYMSENPDIPKSAAIAHVNVNVDLGHYNDIIEVPEGELDSVTVLVNKNFALPENWMADDMIIIAGGFSVREEAAEHLLALQDAVRGAGMRFHIRSTYRSYSSSRYLHTQAVANHGQQIADLNWARGGHSEHQTGLAADVLQRTDSPTLTEARFENTDEYQWLRENAHNYGFILRYPAQYEHIHGYKFEPWHWRYVGVDVASAMFAEQIPVYEEFYGRYLASDVLHNAQRLIQDERERILAEELAIQEQEQAIRDAERLAAEQAELEAQLAFAADEEARLAAEAAARAADEEAMLAAEREAEQLAASEAAREHRIAIAVVIGLVIAICLTGVAMRFRSKKAGLRKGGHSDKANRDGARSANRPDIANREGLRNAHLARKTRTARR